MQHAPVSGGRRRIRRAFGVGLALVGLVATSVLPASGVGATPSGSASPNLTGRPIPPDNADRGLVYGGLKSSAACPGGYAVESDGSCTHGPDPTPVGTDVKADARPATSAREATPEAICSGDGSTGQRIAVLYVRASDKTDRFSTFQTSFRAWAEDASQIYDESAHETGGHRNVRFVHNSSCVITIFSAVIPATGDDSFSATISALQAIGWNRTDRKYMLFVDANVYCGIGNIKDDGQIGAANLNNGGPSYGRTDTGCWGSPVPAHELMHNLGGVQLNAPHTSGGYHCVDEYDRMCYSDSPSFPTMQIICRNPARDRLFDCKHDDYYSTIKKPGSFLATHWNSADSAFLIRGSQGIYGYAWANNATSASYIPSTTYSLDSQGGAITVTRSGVGTYSVKFGLMGTTGGMVHVTAYGATNTHCGTTGWIASGSDEVVGVLCNNPAGVRVDSLYTVSFTKPVATGTIAYAWADQATLASYTPSPTYQYNSDGGTITATRSAVGTYQLLIPNMAGSNGDVQVTAYNTLGRCKVTSWGPSGTSQQVGVKCFSSGGSPADIRFDMTYFRNGNVLGLPGDAGYAWANNSTSASYTPSLGYNFSSAGVSATATRASTGVYAVRFPNLAGSGGYVTVTAYDSLNGHCKVSSWGTSGNDELVNVRCFTAAGAASDQRFDAAWTRV